LNSKKLFTTFCCWVLLGCRLSFAQVSVPLLVSDGMVLQRDAPIRIWGWAAPGEQISVRFKGSMYTGVTGPDRRWVVVLPPTRAGGPYDLDIAGINHITLRGVLVGEVWVCSGQSNMELPMERVKEKYADVIAHAANPFIRQFSVATRFNFTGPLDDLTSGRWEAASPASVLQFSAVGYFFAKALYEKYHVPIGLIKASVGGSPAEAWLSVDALKEFPAYEAVAEKYKDAAWLDSIRSRDKTVTQEWYEQIWHEDKGLHESKPWYDPGYDASAWHTMKVPGYWNDQGLNPKYGVVWYRKEIDVPPALAGMPAKLSLGCIVDRDSVFVNGVFAGTTGYQYPPRRYALPAGMLKPGKNSIVVRVINGVGRGGFVPDKSYQLTGLEGAPAIDLTGNWQYKLGTQADHLPGTTTFQYQPMGLFNGMIAPLLPYSIKGVIWYQGEANTSKAREYRTLFPAMIADWRHWWGEGDFPFLYVQLASFMAVRDQPSESSWAELREAQRRTLAVSRNTGMAVTIDVGEWNDIHPLNKEDVGRRLALVAQRVAYDERRTISSGPMYKSMKIEGNRVRIRFSNVGITDERENLAVRGGGELKGFAIAGADRKYVWARARIDGASIIVWSDQMPNPVAVRYAWADNPQGANLCNKEGLPASPFGTDD